MPTQKELRATMSKKLQEAIKHPDPTVTAGRKSAIKRWVGVLHDNFMEHIKYFKDDKLELLRNVFQDEGCWSGVRLDNAALGQRFTEEKIGGVDNPLSEYDIACRYCVVDKIHHLFQEQFESYKGSFFSNAVDGYGNPVTDIYIRNSLLNGMKRDILGNQGIEVNDLLTLEFATRNGHYDYWLQQIDIAHAGRLRYQLRTEGNHTFEVANLARNDGNEHIVRVLNQFRENEEQQRLTLIITLNNTHWVTLVIERQNGNYVGYYADSTATAVPGGIIDIIQNNLGNNIRINNVSVRQQTDGWNCGLWALENATDINRVLNENPGEQVQNVVNIMRDFLGRGHPNRDRNYFQNIRVSISQLFRNDPGFQDVQLQAYIQNREQIDPLLRTYLELGYHRVGGGCGPVEAPISLSVSDSSNFGGLPQSSLEGPEASRVSDLSKGKGGR